MEVQESWGYERSSSCYRYTLINQEKGFWNIRLWRASLGFSSLAYKRRSFFGEARSDLMFHYWSQYPTIVVVYLDLSLNNKKLVEPTHFHAYIVDIVRLLFRCLRYMLCSYVLNKLNYLISFRSHLVECVLYFH